MTPNKKSKSAAGTRQETEPLAALDDKEKLEDDQIQCSLPLYLDHWFGSKLISHVSPTPTETTSHNSSPSDPILDSQGFLITGRTGSTVEVGHSKRVSSSLIHLSSLPRIEEHLCLEEGGGGEDHVMSHDREDHPKLTHSPLLFTSPEDISDTDNQATIPSTNAKTDLNDSSIHTEHIQQPAQLTSDHKIPQGVSSRDENPKAVNSNSHTDPTRHPVALTADHKAPQGVLTSDKNPKKGRKRKRSPSGPSKEGTVYTCPPGATTLKDCSQKRGTASVLALVLQVNPVMDVACRVGDRAGQTVPMSSLLLADPTKSYFKLSLWRQAASWVERISAGDVIYFRRIRLKTWRREVVGTTTMFSSVLNLHQPKKSLPPKVSAEIPEESVSSLLQWAKHFFGYLFRDSLVPKSQRIVEFVCSDQLSCHPLVHFRGRLLTMVTVKILVLADSPDREVYLYLVGVDSALWSSQLCSGVGRVWEFTFLSTSPDAHTQGGCTLHTTSRSQLRMLARDCQVSTDLLKLFPGEAPGLVTRGQSIAEVLLNKSSGVYQLRAKAERIEFIDGANLSLEHLCSLSASSLVQELCQNCIYVGCGQCSKPLCQDENGVYGQCLSCLLSRPGDQRPSFLHYYRVLAVTLRDDSGTGVVMVTHSVSPKVMGIEPVEFVRVTLSDNKELSEVKEAFCQRMSCLRDCEGVWTVSLGVTKDENSFVQTIAASVMDWSCDSHMYT